MDREPVEVLKDNGDVVTGVDDQALSRVPDVLEFI